MFEALRRLVVGDAAPPTLAVGNLPSYKTGYHTGDKWDAGFGMTELLATDYWTLRARSAQLFRQNHYARGMFRRLLTNEINTGLHLEADPVESVLGRPRDSLADWTEEVEQRFAIWGKSPRVCDALEERTFGKLQAAARLEALVGGDVLVVLPQHQSTGLPRVRLVSGANVQHPYPEPRLQRGHRIVHGVELDAQGRQVAYWVRQPDHSIKRLAAVGEKSGRRLSWLVYGCERRYGETRGEPILSVILQSLRDLDRYRDATLRKAVINSILAMFVTRDSDAPASRGMGAGAVVKGTSQVYDQAGTQRTLSVGEYVPGLVVDFLNAGEDIKSGTVGGTDQAFGEFEAAIVRSMSWAFEVPPEILQLSFSNNYSASQAAIHEFKMYLDRIRMDFGEAFCQPIYESWLVSEVLQGHIVAPGLLDAWRDRSRWDEFGAWTMADWAGHVKPSTDPHKYVRGVEGALALGLITHDRAAREFSGTKFSNNIRKQRRERELMEEAGLTPSAQAPSPAPPPSAPQAPGEPDDDSDEQEQED